jgi:hypothetical protein
LSRQNACHGRTLKIIFQNSAKKLFRKLNFFHQKITRSFRPSVDAKIWQLKIMIMMRVNPPTGKKLSLFLADLLKVVFFCNYSTELNTVILFVAEFKYLAIKLMRILQASANLGCISNTSFSS